MIPPRTILAATDFSEGSRVAVTFAARLAKRCQATFHLIHALDPLLAAAARHAGVDLEHDTRAALQDFMASTPMAADYAPLHDVVCGPAAEVIVAVAALAHADLIVVGGHGMSGAERLLFGSTAAGVLRRASTSVLVVPPSWTPMESSASDLLDIGPIVAAIDFAAPSIEAAAAGCALAATLGTDVDAVHVVPPLPVPERWRPHAEAAVRQRIREAGIELATTVLTLRSPVHIRTRVQSGDVAERLAAVAACTDQRRPMLVLGRRPGRFGAPPGVIAYRVLTLASVPVLMYVPSEVPDAKP